MKTKRSKLRTRKIAVSAMMSALGVVVMALGSVIEVMDLTAVAIASFFVFFAVIEMGECFPYMIYAVTGVLSLMLLPDKFAAVCYLLFGGIYPVLKRYFEMLHKIPSWILKFVYFNIILTAVIWLSLKVLKTDPDEMGFSAVLYLLGNVTFFMYDIAVTKIITLYLMKLRDRFRIGRYFENKH